MDIGGELVHLTRTLISSLLAAVLALAPVGAASQPLGVVLQTQAARIGSGEALPGTTVFSGDTLSTSAGGSLRVRVGGAQIYLNADSAVRLTQADGWTVAGLQQGTVGFSTTGDESLLVRAWEVQVYPQTTRPTHAEVTLVSSRELVVTSYRGPLAVMVGAEVHSVPEATAYRVLLEQEPQEVEGVGAEAARRGRLIGIAAGVTISAAIVTLILLKNAISPSIP